MLCLLDPTKIDDALALVTDLSDNLEDRTLEVRLSLQLFAPDLCSCSKNK